MIVLESNFCLHFSNFQKTLGCSFYMRESACIIKGLLFTFQILQINAQKHNFYYFSQNINMSNDYIITSNIKTDKNSNFQIFKQSGLYPYYRGEVSAHKIAGCHLMGFFIILRVQVILERWKCKNMFKVVLVLKSLAIRLKECECEIILRKDNENLTLCSKAAIQHGNCPINTVKEFYVSIDDSKATLVLYLSQGEKRHYGGEVSLQVLEWEENVIHTVDARVANSPDKDSCLKYQFYYFRDESITDRRAIFMSQQRHAPQYNIIENSNKQLKREKNKLEEEMFSWHKKNEALEHGRQDMVTNLTHREIHHRIQVEHCQQSINFYSEELERQRETKEGLARLAEEHGLNSNWAHAQER